MNRSVAHQPITSLPSVVSLAAGDRRGVRQAAAFYSQAPDLTMLLSSVLPSLIGLLSVLLYDICDIYFISHLGSTALAAFGLVIPVTSAVMGLQFALGSTVVIRISSIMADGTSYELAQCMALALVLASACAIVLTALLLPLFPFIFSSLISSPKIVSLASGYMDIWQIGFAVGAGGRLIISMLRACGDIWSSCWLAVSTSFVNVLLAPLLIFGLGPVPGLGIYGAALASVVTGLFAFLVGLLLLHKRQLLRWFNRQTIKRHLPLMCKQAVPAFAGNISQPIGDSVLSGILATAGTRAVIAYGICMRVELLALTLVIGFKMTTPALVSFHTKTNLARARQTLVGSLALIAGMELGVFVFFLAFAPLIAHWLSPTARVAQITQLYLTYVPLSYAALGLVQLVPSFLNVMQFKCHAMLLIAARAVLLVTLGWLGMHLASVSGTFISIILTNLVAGACAVMVLYWDFHALNTAGERKGIQQ